MALKIVPYKQNYNSTCQQFIAKFVVTYGKKIEIHHVGSTSVPGLNGKGVIDVLIGIRSWNESEEIIRALKTVGIKWHWPKRNGRMFLSNKLVDPAEGDFHIHIVRKETRQYKNILHFRDLLRQNKSTTKEYEQIKKQALKISRNHRGLYKNY